MTFTVIFHNNLVNAEQLIQKIISGKFTEIHINSTSNMAVFTPRILTEFIREEEIHEHNMFGITRQPIKTMSGGEQKKALLNYLLLKNPETLILDNPFDHLDVASQEELKQKLYDISNRINIILLLSRKKDKPEFITDQYIFENNKLFRYTEESDNIETQDHSPLPPPVIPQVFNGTHLIKLQNVSVSFGDKPVLTKINWEIKPGEFWQLIGPNGSGKTTLLSMITGDSVKGYGQELYLFGQKKGTGENVWDLKRKIGYFTSSLTQQFTGRYTAKEMILGGFSDSVGLYQKPTDLQLKLAEDWLKVLGKEYEHVKFCDLSLGQQRMVMITRAMVKHPLLLILDEPTTGLDDENAKKMTYFVNKIAAESTTAILYVSHRGEEGLKPTYNFVLTPSENGSTGNVL